MADKYIIEKHEKDSIWRMYADAYGDVTIEGVTLTPYTEPDTDEDYQRGYETAKHECEDCRKIRADAEQELADKAYQRGLSDAWQAARKIAEMVEGERQCVFGDPRYSVVMGLFSVSEAIEKIKAYEQKEQESITAEEVMRQYLDTFCKGRSCTGCPLYTPDFTCGRGKHFLHDCVSNEEVRKAYAAVLAKMKEEQP